MRLYKVLANKIGFKRQHRIVAPLREILGAAEGDSEGAETGEELMAERKTGLLQINGPAPQPVRAASTTTLEVRFQGPALKEVTKRDLIRLVTSFFPDVGEIDLDLGEHDFVMVLKDQKHTRTVSSACHSGVQHQLLLVIAREVELNRHTFELILDMIVRQNNLFRLGLQQ